MPAILFALISYLGWGIGDIFGTVVTRKIGGYSTAFWSYILFLIIGTFYIPFAVGDLRNASLETYLIILVIGILDVIAFVSFYEALRFGPVSLVGTIVASFAAVTVVVSIIFLKEIININQTIAILIIFFGLILSTLNIKEIKSGKLVLSAGIILALIAMFLWGVRFAITKIPVREIGWFWPNYMIGFLFPLIIVFMKFRKIKLNLPNFKKAFPFLLLSAVLLSVAGYSFNFAISQGLVSVVAPIAGSYPTLFVLLAFIFFKDPITRQQILGIITTLIGIILLSIFSA